MVEWLSGCLPAGRANGQGVGNLDCGRLLPLWGRRDLLRGGGGDALGD